MYKNFKIFSYIQKMTTNTINAFKITAYDTKNTKKYTNAFNKIQSVRKCSNIHIFSKEISSKWPAFYVDLYGFLHNLYILYILYILIYYGPPELSRAATTRSRDSANGKPLAFRLLAASNIGPTTRLPSAADATPPRSAHAIATISWRRIINKNNATIDK